MNFFVRISNYITFCGIISFGCSILKNSGGEHMRLDKFLKINRIIKRRTIAQEVAKAGLVKKDGKVLKPSYEVKPGDILEVSYGRRTLKILVTDDMKCRILEETFRGDEDEKSN